MFGVLQSSFERAPLNRVGLSKRASYTLGSEWTALDIGTLERAIVDQCPLL